MINRIIKTMCDKLITLFEKYERCFQNNRYIKEK